jgi:hypothetical protein
VNLNSIGIELDGLKVIECERCQRKRAKAGRDLRKYVRTRVMFADRKQKEREAVDEDIPQLRCFNAVLKSMKTKAASNTSVIGASRLIFHAKCFSWWISTCHFRF